MTGMKKFNENEIKIIQKLTAASSGHSIIIQKVLQSFYFLEELGRGLIIHNQGNCAVLFLRKDLYENEEIRDKEVNSFLELLLLLNYLSKNGYISIYKHQLDEFYFIQDGFNYHKRVGNDILLNSKGYCTPNIETIIDGNKNVIYKGTIFRGDNYYLISSLMTGSLFVSKRLFELIDSTNCETTDKKGTQPVNSTELPKHKSDKKEPISQIDSASLNKKNETNKFNEKIITEKTGKKSTVDSGRFIAAYVVGALLIAFICYTTVDSYCRIKSLGDRVVLLESKCNDSNGMSNSRQETGTNKQIIYGIDTSKWNGNIENDLTKSDNISFVIIRASMGEKGIDTKFKDNWSTARKKRLSTGAYHFFKVDEDPFNQVDNFVKAINSVGKLDIAPAVDIEMGSIAENNNITPTQVQHALLVFLYYLEKKINRKPMIYTDFSFAETFLSNRHLSDYPLWLAEYSGAGSPSIPTTWKEVGFKIWQKKDDYSIGSQHTDFDEFNGSIQDLIK